MLAQEMIGEWVIFRQVPGGTALYKDFRGMRADCAQADVKCTGYFLGTPTFGEGLQDVQRALVSQRLRDALASPVFLEIHVMLYRLCRVGYMLDTGEIGS